MHVNFVYVVNRQYKHTGSGMKNVRAAHFPAPLQNKVDGASKTRRCAYRARTLHSLVTSSQLVSSRAGSSLTTLSSRKRNASCSDAKPATTRLHLRREQHVHLFAAYQKWLAKVRICCRCRLSLSPSQLFCRPHDSDVQNPLVAASNRHRTITKKSKNDKMRG